MLEAAFLLDERLSIQHVSQQSPFDHNLEKTNSSRHFMIIL